MLRFVLAVLMFAGSLGRDVVADEPKEIVLWVKGMPEPVVPAEPPELVEKGPDGTGRRTNVSQPRLFGFYPPAGAARTGAAVVVVPGGGFGRLADDHEGTQCAEFLAKHGLVAFSLAHRTPTTKHKEPNLGPAQDVQQAVSEIRRRAGDLKIDPKKIGVLGFSAGGQVSLVAATNDRLHPTEGAQTSHKPDFLLLIYAWKIYDPAAQGLRSDIRLEAGLPPTFIAQASDDASSLPIGSTLLYMDLLNRKTPAELHIYEKGGHGFGMRPRAGATGPTDWPLRAVDWLQLRGYANKRGAT